MNTDWKELVNTCLVYLDKNITNYMTQKLEKTQGFNDSVHITLL